MIKLAQVYHKRFVSLKIASHLSTVQGYKLLSSNYSDDFKLQVNQLIHEQTGAKVYHFQRNDEDNTFATIFKTFPSDSKGTPHILQHLACCGSQKYPIRDPFFNMLKRSVNTYMNAWTGQDFTCYPFSSANPKDWKNLLNVYTDMSFRPLLNELDFMQEGWRYEMNQQGEKEIKGIVFNEMKGAYQSAERQLMVALNEALFAGTGYVHDSGGKPEEIVNLTYQQLLDMHNHFYHPSNMSLFLYGNQNIEQTLKKINEEYLSKYQKATNYNHGNKISPHLPKQHFKTISSKTAETRSVSLFFYIKNIEELSPVESLTFKILQYLMLQKNTSYIYQSFIENGIAQNMGHSGFNESKLASFGVTLKGIDEKYEPQTFYNQVIKVFEKISTQGINQKRLQQFLHELEISIKTPRSSYGIKLLQDCLNYMNHRLEVIGFMQPLKYIPEAKQVLLNKEKLSEFIHKHFISNKHFVVIRQVMQPQGQQQQQASTPQEQKKIKSSIVIPDQQIRSKQEQLKQRQSIVQDVNILPKLQLSDLITRNRLTPTIVQDRTLNNRRLRYIHVPIQNQIHFYRFVFNFKNLPLDINDKLSLWNFLINKGISTKSYNYKQLSSKLGQFTANFYSATSFGVRDSVNVVLGISCLKRNKQQLFKVIQEILFEPVFQVDNVKNLYRAYQNQTIETLTDTPIGECLDECGSALNLTSRLFNKYQKIKVGLQVARQENIVAQKQISDFLLHADNIYLIQHSNQKCSRLPAFFQRFEHMPSKKFQPINFTPQFLSKSITHNFDINFCTQQYLGPEYLSKQHAQMCILTQYLEQQYLHPQIREKGGAYGARSSVRESGNISLYSYMDPQATKTFKVFDQSVEKIRALDKMPEDKLNEIKITLIGEMERIKVPQEECVSQILKGYGIQEYEQYLEWVKNADSREILQVGRKYFDSNRKSRCVFGKEVPQGFMEEKLSDLVG